MGAGHVTAQARGGKRGGKRGREGCEDTCRVYVRLCASMCVYVPVVVAAVRGAQTEPCRGSSASPSASTSLIWFRLSSSVFSAVFSLSAAPNRTTCAHTKKAKRQEGEGRQCDGREQRQTAVRSGSGGGIPQPGKAHDVKTCTTLPSQPPRLHPQRGGDGAGGGGYAGYVVVAEDQGLQGRVPAQRGRQRLDVADIIASQPANP